METDNGRPEYSHGQGCVLVVALELLGDLAAYYQKHAFKFRVGAFRTYQTKDIYTVMRRQEWINTVGKPAGGVRIETDVCH